MLHIGEEILKKQKVSLTLLKQVAIKDSNTVFVAADDRADVILVLV